MNSNLNKFDFDFGIGSNNRSSRPLNEQKNKSNSSYSSPSYTSSSSSFSQPKTAPLGKPSWTHQLAPSQPSIARTELGAPTSMVGDIKGKSWTCATPQSAAGVGVGIVNKNPNLFGDLVNSALGQNKTTSNAPLKSVAPSKSSFSMAGVANSLPKTTTSNNNNNNAANIGGGTGTSWGTYHGVGSGIHSNSNASGYGISGLSKGSGGLGGPSLHNGGAGGGGAGMGAKMDPFGSLVGLSLKPMGGGASLGGSLDGKSVPTLKEDFAFGGFQNASKSDTPSFPSGNNNPLGPNAGSFPKMGGMGTQSQTPVQSTGADPIDIFFPSASATEGSNAVSDGADGGQQFSDWGEFEGGHDDGVATDHEGLPPPPAGVSASTAKTKGLDNYKQGQYADAIKWLSWAEILLEKAGESAGSMEVLSCRASCYKEVGDYKKAVADCTKVLDHDGTNVTVLVQRALLYESMEKYGLGAEDLTTVMKLDPGNRVARSTIHRLKKLAD